MIANYVRQLIIKYSSRNFHINEKYKIPNIIFVNVQLSLMKLAQISMDLEAAS